NQAPIRRQGSGRTDQRRFPAPEQRHAQNSGARLCPARNRGREGIEGGRVSRDRHRTPFRGLKNMAYKKKESEFVVSDGRKSTSEGDLRPDSAPAANEPPAEPAPPAPVAAPAPAAAAPAELPHVEPAATQEAQQSYQATG